MIVIELDQKICRIGTVHPLGTVFYVIFCCLSGDGITEDHLADGLSAEKANVEFLYRTDPIRNSLIVDLKAELVKHICGIIEPQMPVNISVEIFGLGIFDTLMPYRFGYRPECPLSGSSAI